MANSADESRAEKNISQPFEVLGIDNLYRPGSELNRFPLQCSGVQFFHGDLRSQSDLEQLPKLDWIIDCAALVDVLSGVDGKSSSRQVVEHNLYSTVNLLEICRRDLCGLILLSTSRVYSIEALQRLPLKVVGNAYTLDESDVSAALCQRGIRECFSTSAPTSLYAATKLASERLAMEYSLAFGFPLRINRCGVLAGAGQFGRMNQGLFSYWIHSHQQRRPLQYIGFGGRGYQVRDCMHPRDLANLVRQQIATGIAPGKPVVANVNGGVQSARSLRQLNDWCDARFGTHSVTSNFENRMFDVPWLVLDSSLAETAWDWHPQTSVEQIWEEIAQAAESSSNWLERSN